MRAPATPRCCCVTVARLQHVSSYSWLQEVLDHVQAHMMRYERSGVTPSISTYVGS